MVNVSELTQEEREQLKHDLKVEEQKTKWSGKHGIWADFRRIGKNYAMLPVREMSDSEKATKLQEEINAFFDSRLLVGYKK